MCGNIGMILGGTIGAFGGAKIAEINNSDPLTGAIFGGGIGASAGFAIGTFVDVKIVEKSINDVATYTNKLYSSASISNMQKGE